MDDVGFIHLIRGAYHQAEELRRLYDHHLKPLHPRTVIAVGPVQSAVLRLFLDLMGEHGTLICLTRGRRRPHRHILEDRRYHGIEGDPSDPRTLKKVRALAARCDCLFFHGGTSPFRVLHDTDIFLPLLRNGGAAIWTDVRREKPEGIKQAWYGVLKPRLLGATEHYDHPYGPGFGIWYKTEDSAASVLDQAERFLEAGKDMQAEGLLRRLTAHRRGHGHAWFDLAMALWDHRVEEAREALAMAVAARPNLYPHAYEWTQQVGEPTPPPLGESVSDVERSAAVDRLTEMGLYRRALEVLDTLPAKAPDGPAGDARRVALLEACHAPMRDVIRALTDAVKASDPAARPGLLEREGTRIVNGMLRLQKYADAVRLCDTLAALCPPFAVRAGDLLSHSLAFCVWAAKHGLAGRGHRRPANYFRKLVADLQAEGLTRIAVLPAGTICGMLLENVDDAALQFTLYDTYKAGTHLAGIPIEDARTLVPDKEPLLLLASLSFGEELYRGLLDRGVAPTTVRDITQGQAAFASLGGEGTP